MRYLAASIHNWLRQHGIDLPLWGVPRYQMQFIVPTKKQRARLRAILKARRSEQSL